MSMKTFLAVVLCGACFLPQLAAHAAAPKETPSRSSPEPLSLELGKRVPGFWAHTAGGQIVHIDDPTLRKQWVLVEFWHSREGDRDRAVQHLAALRKHFLAEDRLLIFSICIDLEFEDWMKYVSAQKDLVRLNGDHAKFYSDSRWWQLSLGVNDEKEIPELIERYGLKKMPQYYLIRPDETLAARDVPQVKLIEVLAEQLEKVAK